MTPDEERASRLDEIIYRLRKQEDLGSARTSASVNGHGPPDALDEDGQEQEQPLPVFETAASFMALTFPPPRWIVPDFIPANLSGCICGTAHVGKTAVAINATKRALERGESVAYVVEESTGDDFQDRLKFGGVDESLQLGLRILFQKGVQLGSARWLAHLAEQLMGVSVCFFDTFSDVTELDQLDHRAMLKTFQDIRALRIATGCTIVPLMHSPKAIFAGNTPPSLADVFGSVGAVNTLDFVFILRPMDVKPRNGDGRDDQYLADQAAQRQSKGRVELHCRKLRGAGAPAPEPAIGQLVVHETGRINSDGRPITTVSFSRLEDTSVNQARKAAKVELIREAILNFCGEHEVSAVRDLKDAKLGFRYADVQQACKDMLFSGQLVRDVALNLRPSGRESTPRLRATPGDSQENGKGVSHPSDLTEGVTPDSINLKAGVGLGVGQPTLIVKQPEERLPATPEDEPTPEPIKSLVTCLSFTSGKPCGAPCLTGLAWCQDHWSKLQGLLD